MATNIYTDTESYCMEKLFEEFKTVTWSSKLYTPSDLAKMKNSFPIIVKISSSKLGDRFYEDYSSGQVLYLHSIKEQLRFLAYDEEGNEFSIPINSDIGLETADTQEDLILHEHLELPVEIKFKFDSDQNERSPDLLLRQNNTVLTIKQKGLMKYLMAVCMSQDVFVKAIECIPAESSNLGLSVALNIGDGMDDRLTLFEEHVQDVVQQVIDEKTFNSYQGNPDIIINAQLSLLEVQEESIDDNYENSIYLQGNQYERLQDEDYENYTDDLKLTNRDRCDDDDSYERRIHTQEETRTNNSDNENYYEVTNNNKIELLDGYCTVNPSKYDQTTSSSSQNKEGIGNTSLGLDSVQTTHQDIRPKLPPRNMTSTNTKSTTKSKVIQEKTPQGEHRIKGKQDLPDNLSDMTCNQVQDCLKLLKLDKHVRDFQEIGIDGNLLMSLDQNIMKTELNLKELEILKLEMLINKKWLPQVE